MTAKSIITAVLLVALVGGLVVAQGEGCPLMDGARHAAMACPAGILPLVLVLGLMIVSLVVLRELSSHGQLVLVPIDRPPRPTSAR